MDWLQNVTKEQYLLLAVIIIALFQLFDTRILVAIIVVIIIIIHYEKLMYPLSQKKDTRKDQISKDLYYNDTMERIIQELSNYKKYNKVTFKQGVRNFRKYLQTIHTLEKDNISHYNPYFENAMIYLKQSINHFKSMSVSMPEDDYLHGLKYNDFTGTTKTTHLNKLVDELYTEGYHILLNLSRKYNTEWSTNPRVYNKEITLNSDRVEDFDIHYDNHWNLV